MYTLNLGRGHTRRSQRGLGRNFEDGTGRNIHPITFPGERRRVGWGLCGGRLGSGLRACCCHSWCGEGRCDLDRPGGGRNSAGGGGGRAGRRAKGSVGTRAGEIRGQLAPKNDSVLPVRFAALCTVQIQLRRQRRRQQTRARSAAHGPESRVTKEGKGKRASGSAVRGRRPAGGRERRFPTVALSGWLSHSFPTPFNAPTAGHKTYPCNAYSR